MKNLLKKLYNIIPLKKELYLILKNIYVPPKKVYQHLHFVAIFSVSVSKGKKFKIKHYGYQL